MAAQDGSPTLASFWFMRSTLLSRVNFRQLELLPGPGTPVGRAFPSITSPTWLVALEPRHNTRGGVCFQPTKRPYAGEGSRRRRRARGDPGGVPGYPVASDKVAVEVPSSGGIHWSLTSGVDFHGIAGERSARARPRPLSSSRARGAGGGRGTCASDGAAADEGAVAAASRRTRALAAAYLVLARFAKHSTMRHRLKPATASSWGSSRSTSSSSRLCVSGVCSSSLALTSSSTLGWPSAS